MKLKHMITKPNPK